MAYEVGARVVVNDTHDWAPFVGLHGTVRSFNDPDAGGPPDKPYSVNLDPIRGSSPFFMESELDPE
jgi:hypothetical protein